MKKLLYGLVLILMPILILTSCDLSGFEFGNPFYVESKEKSTVSTAESSASESSAKSSNAYNSTSSSNLTDQLFEIDYFAINGTKMNIYDFDGKEPTSNITVSGDLSIEALVKNPSNIKVYYLDVTVDYMAIKVNFSTSFNGYSVFKADYKLHSNESRDISVWIKRLYYYTDDGKLTNVEFAKVCGFKYVNNTPTSSSSTSGNTSTQSNDIKIESITIDSAGLYRGSTTNSVPNSAVPTIYQLYCPIFAYFNNLNGSTLEYAYLYIDGKNYVALKDGGVSTGGMYLKAVLEYSITNGKHVVTIPRLVYKDKNGVTCETSFNDTFTFNFEGGSSSGTASTYTPSTNSSYTGYTTGSTANTSTTNSNISAFEVESVCFGGVKAVKFSEAETQSKLDPNYKLPTINSAVTLQITLKHPSGYTLDNLSCSTSNGDKLTLKNEGSSSDSTLFKCHYDPAIASDMMITLYINSVEVRSLSETNATTKNISGMYVVKYERNYQPASSTTTQSVSYDNAKIEMDYVEVNGKTIVAKEVYEKNYDSSVLTVSNNTNPDVIIWFNTESTIQVQSIVYEYSKSNNQTLYNASTNNTRAYFFSTLDLNNFINGDIIFFKINKIEYKDINGKSYTRDVSYEYYFKFDLSA